MSWLQWRGEVWSVTDDEAELQVHLASPELACPKVSWTWDLMHNPSVDGAVKGKRKVVRWLSAEVANLPLAGRDWREWSGLEIRADAAWHERNEFFGDYGHHHLAEVGVCMFGWKPGDASDSEGEFKHWVAHDFVLRFGTREGLVFPCELDAWMLPKEEYYRKGPESAKELLEFGKGTPNLRLMTNAIFLGGSVSLPRLGDNPKPEALRRLRQEIGCRDAANIKVNWQHRYKESRKETEPMVGWRSTVNFTTTEDS